MTERWANSTIFFVRNAGAAAAFYADMLGFTVNWRHDEAGRTWAAGISRDDCGLLLHSQQPDRVGKGVIYLAFGAAEYDVLRADLQAKGGVLKDGWGGKRLGIVAGPGRHQLWVAEPRGRA